MFGSAVLDVAIGVIFVFLLVSLIVTTANEFVAALLSSRAKWLKIGIERLLGSAWAAKLYEHPLVESSSLGRTGASYIASRTFAGALLDLVGAADKTLQMATNVLSPVLQNIPPESDRDAFIELVLPALQAMANAGGTAKAMSYDIINLISRLPNEGFNAASAATTVRAMLEGSATSYIGPLIANIEDARVQRVLKVLYDEAGGDVVKLRQNIEIWFNSAMDRVGGWYKRKSQWVIALIAIIVTLALNVDAMLIAQHLNTQSALRDAVVAQAKAFADIRTAADRGGVGAESSVAGNPKPPSEVDVAASARAVDAQLEKLSLPIGWYQAPESGGNDPIATFRRQNRLILDASAWLDIVQFHIVGWLLTALAASLGAPFWFDTLNRFMAVRAAGKPPEGAAQTARGSRTSLSLH
jgi:hypothetical protein